MYGGSKISSFWHNTEATHPDTQTNLFLDCLTPPWIDGDHGLPSVLGLKALGPGRTVWVLVDYVLTYISEAVKSGIQVAVREVAKPSH